MASVPQQNTLPLLYRELTPLSSQEHAGWRARRMEDLSILRGVHAVPLTVDEFVAAQRCYPIIFSTGDDPVPLALMGLTEGSNLFLGEDNMLTANAYLPAYVRRYPFMLARLREETDELSLCFDPSADLIGAFDEGVPLFDGTDPSADIKATLEFCEQFEIAGQRTNAFMAELKQFDLLTEGEVTINVEGAEQPFIYRGFKIVAEEKMRELRGDQLRKFNQSGLLPLLHAHIFSLPLIIELFNRQQGAATAATSAPALI